MNIGFALGYEKLSKDVYMNNDLEFHKESKYYTLATELEFRYTNRDKIQLYSGFGLGLTCQADNQDNKSAPDKSETMCRATGQLILFGVRGGSEFSPFFEFGCGYKGIINFGLSYQF